MSLVKIKQTNLALLIARLTFGGLMLLAHGIPKVTGFPNANFPDPLGVGATLSMGLAIFAECVCAFLLCIGLWTRLSVIPLIITMLTAVILVHGGDPFQRKELGLIYLLGYIIIFISGPGDYSVDKKLNR